MINKQSWAEEFDIKFTRICQGGEDKGKYMDSWFVKDAIQSKEIKQFIKKLLTSKAEQMEGEKKDINFSDVDDIVKND